MRETSIGEKYNPEPLQIEPISFGSDMALVLERLTCRYNYKTVVENLSLQVPIGSVYGFLGPNGAGKTTTIKTLLGMRSPYSGRASIFGFDVTNQGVEARKRIGYMSETNNLYGFMRVWEILEVARRMSARWNAQLVNRYLELFQLAPGTKIDKLSKGMRGQLALTVALGSEPDLLILDEPTSGLDPLKRYEFLNQVVREVTSAGRTIFFSSHNLNEVEQIADRIAIINQGKLVVEDELDNLKLREKAVKVAFDRPVWVHDLESISGVKKVMQEGRRFRLLVSGDAEEVVAELLKLGAISAEVVDMNLEAIFVNYLQEQQNPGTEFRQ